MEIKNDLAKCAKDHYFNAAVHSVCPICGSPAVPVSAPASFTSTEQPDTGAVPGGNAGGFATTEPPMGGVGGFATTEPPMGGVGSFIPTEAPMGGVGSFIPTEAPMGPGAAGFYAGPGVTVPVDPWTAPGGAVNPFSVPTTIGVDIAAPGQVDPVVGWVVCVDGPLRGADWRIRVGYNYIGREVGDILIQGDSQISREKHAMIAYHNKNRTYYVGPAEGRNIIELNGEPVFNATKLSKFDIITIGATKLMFVPLCDDTFTWDQERDNA